MVSFWKNPCLSAAFQETANWVKGCQQNAKKKMLMSFFLIPHDSEHTK